MNRKEILSSLKKIAQQTPEGIQKFISTGESFYAPYVKIPEDKQPYIERAFAEISSQNKDFATKNEAPIRQALSEVWDDQFKKNNGKAHSNPAHEQHAIRSKSEIDQAHRGKTLKDGLYTYKISDDGKSLTFSTEKNPKEIRLDQTYRNWDTVVKNIDSIDQTKQVTESATPQAMESEVEKQPAKQPDVITPQIDSLTKNVAKIISNVNAGHTYAGKTIFTNEMAMVRGMLASISAAGTAKGVVLDPSLTLAQIILASNRSGLQSTNLSKYTPEQVSSMSERDIEKAFRGELDVIMRAVVQLDKALGGKRGYENISRYFSIGQPVIKNKDGTVSKQSSANENKITRLASLRRVKVRNQMDEAIKNTALIGKSRV